MNLGELNIIDIFVLVGYIGLVIAFGLWSSCRKASTSSVGGYFLAGRSMPWILIGCSLYSSDVSVGHFIALSGSGAAGGLGVASYEFNALILLVLLGWVFAPVYLASGIFTMPEYLYKRFGGQRIRIYITVLTFINHVFIKIAPDLYSGAIFIYELSRVPYTASIVFLLIMSGVFSIIGGLSAVIWTDFVQTIIMLSGGIYLTTSGVVAVGGYDAVFSKFMTAIPNTTSQAALWNLSGANTNSSRAQYAACGRPPENALSLLRPADDPELPWPGVFLGITVLSIFYWCAEQSIVQRALSAKSVVHARAACVLAGVLKSSGLWLLVLPGMIARILYTDEVACADPDVCEAVCGNRGGCHELAYPKLVSRLLPHGAKGLLLSVIIAALVSSFTSVFNSSKISFLPGVDYLIPIMILALELGATGTIFTIDMWLKIRNRATQNEQLLVGRLFVLVLMAVSVCWLPIIFNFNNLLGYIMAILSYTITPLSGIFVLAVLWPRCTEAGAFWSLIIGLVIGLARFIWEFSYPTARCGEPDTRPEFFARFSTLYFAFALAAFTDLLAIGISLLTTPIAPQHLHRLHFWSRNSIEPREDLDNPARRSPPTANGSQQFSNVNINTVLCNNGHDVEREVELQPTAVAVVQNGCGPAISVQVALPAADSAVALDACCPPPPPSSCGSMCVITAAEPASASASASASSFWWLALRWLCGLESAEADEHARAVAAASGKADGEADGETGQDGGRGEDAGLEYAKRERASDRAAGWRARAAHCAVNAGAVLMVAYYVFLYVFFD